MRIGPAQTTTRADVAGVRTPDARFSPLLLRPVARAQLMHARCGTSAVRWRACRRSCPQRHAADSALLRRAQAHAWCEAGITARPLSHAHDDVVVAVHAQQQCCGRAAAFSRLLCATTAVARLGWRRAPLTPPTRRCATPCREPSHRCMRGRVEGEASVRATSAVATSAARSKPSRPQLLAPVQHPGPLHAQMCGAAHISARQPACPQVGPPAPWHITSARVAAQGVPGARPAGVAADAVREASVCADGALATVPASPRSRCASICLQLWGGAAGGLPARDRSIGRRRHARRRSEERRSNLCDAAAAPFRVRLPPNFAQRCGASRGARISAQNSKRLSQAF